MFEVKISHEGATKDKSLGMAGALDAAMEMIDALGERYLQWEGAGFPDIPEDDPCRFFEGCEVSATNQETGELYYLEGTEDGDIWWKAN